MAAREAAVLAVVAAATPAVAASQESGFGGDGGYRWRRPGWFLPARIGGFVPGGALKERTQAMLTK